MMDTARTRRRVLALLFALGLAGVVSIATAQAPEPAEAPPAGEAAATWSGDPDWGVLAELPGTYWRPEHPSIELHVWEWVEPGRVMRRRAPDSYQSDATIRLDEAAGGLVWQEFLTPKSVGRVLEDGSVRFDRGGRGVRYSRDADGGLLVEWVRLEEGEVNRFVRYFDLSADHAEAMRATAGRVADPRTWGIYARLLGSEFIEEDSYRAWRWGEGDEIIEDRGNQGTVLISPDGPASLVMRQAGETRWRGRIEGDGSVLWIAPVGMRVLSALVAESAHPHRVREAADGIAVERVRVQDGRVASVVSTRSMRGRFGAAAADAATAAAPPEDAAPSRAAVRAPATTAATPDSPAAAPAPPSEPAPPPFQGLERYLGRRMIDIQNEALEMNLRPDGALLIDFYGLDGSKKGRYIVVPDGPRHLRLAQSAYDDARHEPTAAWAGASSILAVSSKTGRRKGTVRHYVFQPNGDSLKVRRYGEDIGLFLQNKGKSYDTTMTMVPMTAELAQEAAMVLARRREQARIDRINREREEQARSDMFHSMMGAVLTGVSQGMAEAQQHQQMQQQAIDEARIRAQAAADWREQQARQERMQEQQQQLLMQQMHAQQQGENQALARQQAEQRQAQAQAEQRRMAAAQAEADRLRRQQEAEAARQREAEARRLAEERAKREREEAWQRSLQQARASLRLAATTCPGGGGRYYVRGPRTSVQGCVSISYEARCPSTPQGAGVRGFQGNYIGGSCLGVGDAIEIPGSPLSCPAEQVRVDVLSVTGC